MIADQAA